MSDLLGTDAADFICQHAEWLYYDIPQPLADKLWSGQYKGQKQKWIALQFTGQDSFINIDTDEPEFCEWRWLPPYDLIEMAVPFKRDVYQNVISTFTEHLRNST